MGVAHRMPEGKPNEFSSLMILAGQQTIVFFETSSNFVAAETADKQAVRKIQLFSIHPVLLR